MFSKRSKGKELVSIKRSKVGSLTIIRKGHYATQATLTKSEQQQLATWNATEREYCSDTCVPELIELQATATPDAIALVANNQVLRYQELNRRANQLAHYLRALGVGPNIAVGLCIERSLDMVIGLVGILKAGGAYVPLDTACPSDRLAFMLEDSSAQILVTRRHIAVQLSTHRIQSVCLDADDQVLAEQNESDPTWTVKADDLAYIIYTSGTTGQPKGVQIAHKSLLNLIFWHQRAFSVSSSDRATQVANPAFDATGWEMWPYLTIGASVYLPNEDIRLSPTQLRDWLVEQQITCTFLPTALAESVISLKWPSTSRLRFLLTGADTLHRYPATDLPFALINNYGPTEGTVVTTSDRVLPTEHPDEPPSIGRPIANTQIYILDEHLRQVPIGTAGELYIGGAGLAKGYLNRPELTDERFISHPFSSEPGARLYKTGDLARFLPDGQIAFLGRTDHQVKIRGYRIELGEIETILKQHPAVRQAVVVIREDLSGEKHLVAYIAIDQQTPASEQQLFRGRQYVSDSELRCFLQRQLPDYMLPTTFVQMEALPLTPNGKIDRTALPAPDETRVLDDRSHVEPGTPIEERLAAIMVALLGLKQIGIDDNIFLLGGHSLLGTQIIMRIANNFGVDLTLRTLFEAPTVRQLAAEVERLVLIKVEAMSEEEVVSLLEQE